MIELLVLKIHHGGEIAALFKINRVIENGLKPFFWEILNIFQIKCGGRIKHAHLQLLQILAGDRFGSYFTLFRLFGRLNSRSRGMSDASSGVPWSGSGLNGNSQIRHSRETATQQDDPSSLWQSRNPEHPAIGPRLSPR